MKTILILLTLLCAGCTALQDIHNHHMRWNPSCADVHGAGTPESVKCLDEQIRFNQENFNWAVYGNAYGYGDPLK